MSIDPVSAPSPGNWPLAAADETTPCRIGQLQIQEGQRPVREVGKERVVAQAQEIIVRYLQQVAFAANGNAAQRNPGFTRAGKGGAAIDGIVGRKRDGDMGQ